MKRIVFEWGHDFRPEYRNLKHIIKQLGDVPIIGLTATATPKVQEDILKTWICLTRLLLKSFNRPNLYYEVRTKTKNIESDIIRFIKQQRKIRNYLLLAAKVEAIAEVLQVNGISAPYHAD
jgi:ATP-dependent DNA helicase RecQ